MVSLPDLSLVLNLVLNMALPLPSALMLAKAKGKLQSTMSIALGTPKSTFLAFAEM